MIAVALVEVDQKTSEAVAEQPAVVEVGHRVFVEVHMDSAAVAAAACKGSVRLAFAVVALQPLTKE